MKTFKQYLLEKLSLLDNADISGITKTKTWKDAYIKIKQITSASQDNSFNYNALQNCIYDVLTQVPEMEQALSVLYGSDLASSQEYKQHNTQYKAVLSKIESYVGQSKSWKVENTGAWCHFVRSGQKGNSSKTFKWYGTLKEREVDSIKIVSNVIYDLSKIKTDWEIQLKVPGSYGAFIKHIDSIVIHYHDESLKNEIVKVMEKYKSHLADRARLSRTDHGVDDKAYGDKGSDSMIIAKKFADTIKKNKDVIEKYFGQKNEDEMNKILLSILNKIMTNSTHRS